MERDLDGRIEYGLHTPIPGGSSYDIKWDDETITVQLPPVGFTFDRIPDQKTGKESREIIPCEVFNANLAIPDQKWKRQGLPRDWKKWRKEEKQRNRTDPDFVNPDAEKFRQTHWTRRVNGAWLALGNRSNKPTEYYYLPGPYWHFLNWWKQEFGYPEFRVAQWEIYLSLCWAYDNPLVHGITFAGNRRGGKTSISMHHLFEYPSRVRMGKAGMQAQTKEDARKKWDESFVLGFLSQPDFYRPKYDKTNQLKREILFRPKISTNLDVDDSDEIVEGALNSRIDFRETKSTAYDGYKMHRISFEEPGKWVEADVDQTVGVLVPCTKNINGAKIGTIFAPTTIEDMDDGGAEFIKLAENSRPSLMKRNESGKTASSLVHLYQPAYRNFIVDEYGRPIVDDPSPDEKIYDQDGKRVMKGSKSILQLDREAVRHDWQKYVQLVRQYSFTWEEAKMMDTSQSPFNVEILEKRYNELNTARSYPYVKGNFAWVNKVDGEVEFVRDDVAGRWAIHLNPDAYGDYFDGDNRVTNRVGYEFYQGKKFWFPKNNKLFRIGTDPIRYNKTDDPRASKAAAYVWYKFDPAKDLKKPISQWISHNFIAQYLVRPNEFEIYGEDMIMACRYFGCSILPEPTVTNLEQHMVARGYGRFVLYRKDFSDHVIPKKTQSDDYKGMDAIDLVIDAWVGRLVTLVNKHGQRFLFPQLCEQMIKFKIKDRTRFDAVVGAGYAVLAGDAEIEDPIDRGDNVEDDSWFTQFEVDEEGHTRPADDTEASDFFND